MLTRKCIRQTIPPPYPVNSVTSTRESVVRGGNGGYVVTLNTGINVNTWNLVQFSVNIDIRPYSIYVVEDDDTLEVIGIAIIISNKNRVVSALINVYKNMYAGNVLGLQPLDSVYVVNNIDVK